MDVKYHVISTLVENKPGVLQKGAGLFTRRDFNIDSITVGESEVDGLARMVITVKADEKILEQVTKQLNKLVDVIKIKDISKNAVKRELCLVKVNIPNEKARAEIMQYANIFRAKIVDVTEETLIIEITGDMEKINAFISLLKGYGIKKISTPGRRVYSGYKDLPRVYNGYGTVIVSTSLGVTTGKKASEKMVGGELICTVW